MFGFIIQTARAFYNSLSIAKLSFYLIVAVLLFAAAVPFPTALLSFLFVSAVFEAISRLGTATTTPAATTTPVAPQPQSNAPYRELNLGSAELRRLIAEVGNGHYDNFRNVLNGEHITHLNINSMYVDFFLANPHLLDLLPPHSNTLINAELVARLGIALQGTMVNKVTLTSNHMNAEDAVRLIEGLQHAAQVTELILDDNPMGDINLTNLNSALQRTQIRKISLNATNMSTIRLQGTQITDLSFGCNPTNVEELAGNLENTAVTTLKVDGILETHTFLNNPLGSERTTRLVTLLSTTPVTYLSLKNNGIGDDTTTLATALQDAHFSALILDGNSINTNGLRVLVEHLQNNHHLKKLSFKSNYTNLIYDYDGEGFENIPFQNTSIVSLDLKLNNIPSGRIGAALSGSSVKTLALSCFNTEQFEEFMATINNTQVTHLTVSTATGNIVPFAAALRESRITHLHFELFNDFSDAEQAALTAHIPGTFLQEVSITTQNIINQNNTINNIPELQEALRANRERIWTNQLTPFYISRLQNLPENVVGSTPEDEVQNTLTLPQTNAATTPEEEIKFAAGIFTSLGKVGHSDIQDVILSYLPEVSPSLAYQYRLAARAARNNQLPTTANAIDEVTDSNPRLGN